MRGEEGYTGREGESERGEGEEIAKKEWEG